MKSNLEALAHKLRTSPGLSAKSDIAVATSRLDVSGASSVPVGDDCAAIPDGEGYALFAIEGFMNQFVATDPWFAGWCGVMVNVSDVAAMGGRPVAVVDAIWANGEHEAAPVFDGLHAAARAFGIPVVGGHTNLKTDRSQLSVAILGKAKNLLTSFDARPGDRLIAAIDLRGRYREHFSIGRRRRPPLTRGYARITNCCRRSPRPVCANLQRTSARVESSARRQCLRIAQAWARSSTFARSRNRIAYPTSAGCSRFQALAFLLSVSPDNVPDVMERFRRRDISANDVGVITAERRVVITDGSSSETICDLSVVPLLGCGPRGVAA